MFENRIQDYFASAVAVAEHMDLVPGFVPCSLPLFGVFSPQQQAFIGEIYRRAQELAEAQRLAAQRVWRLPEFSLN